MITSVVNLIYYLVLRLIFKTTFKIKQHIFLSFHALTGELMWVLAVRVSMWRMFE